MRGRHAAHACGGRQREPARHRPRAKPTGRTAPIQRQPLTERRGGKTSRGPRVPLAPHGVTSDQLARRLLDRVESGSTGDGCRWATERFEVKSGTMRFKLGVKPITAGPGETVGSPPRAALARWRGRAERYRPSGADGRLSRPGRRVTAVGLSRDWPDRSTRAEREIPGLSTTVAVVRRCRVGTHCYILPGSRRAIAR